MTSSTNVSANVPFSSMKAVYMDRSIEKALAKGVATKKDIIVTNSDYTRQTRENAKKLGVDLWNRDKLIELLKKYPTIFKYKLD